MFQTSMSITPAPAKFSPLLFAGEWQLALETACELKFDAVEVSLRDPDNPVLAQLAAGITQNGLQLSAVATGQSYYNDGLSLLSADPGVQQRMLDRLKGFVDFAAPWKAIVILGGVRGMLTGDPASYPAQKDAFLSCLGKICPYAKSAGVRLAFEPINRYETNFLNTIRECCEIIDQVGFDNLGVLPDTFHMNIEEANMPEAILKARTKVMYLHFPDSNRRAPGQGHIHFDELIQALQQMDYSGYICAEILPLPDSRKAAELAIAYFHKLQTLMN